MASKNLAFLKVNETGDWVVTVEKQQTVATQDWAEVHNLLLPLFPYLTQGMTRALMHYVAVTKHTFVFMDALV